MRGVTEWDEAVLLCLTPPINLFPLQVYILLQVLVSIQSHRWISQNCPHVSLRDLSTNLANVTALSQHLVADDGCNISQITHSIKTVLCP